MEGKILCWLVASDNQYVNHRFCPEIRPAMTSDEQVKIVYNTSAFEKAQDPRLRVLLQYLAKRQYLFGNYSTVYAAPYGND